jgi:peptidoglycan/LPS O-acetylase OafA/YrhL
MNQKSQIIKNRNAWLYTLRGFSAIWVILYHLNGRIPEQDNLYYYFVRYRQGIWLESLPLHIFYDFSVLVTCLCLSFLFYKYIENPAIAAGKKSFNFNLKTNKNL